MKVVALHFTKKCNMNCECCYRQYQKTEKELPKEFFIKLIPYIKEIAPQVAVGGGECLLFPEFIKEFAKECKKNNLYCNITTNGTLIPSVDDSVFKDITMVSISFDKYKIKAREDVKRFTDNIKKLKGLGVLVGVNFLIDAKEMEKCKFVKIVDWFFHLGVDRVFALYPKNVEFIDILKHKKQYEYLTLKYKNFYVDDLTSKILAEGYDNWKTPCHYGKDVISIDENGYVAGCSFETEKVLKLQEPSDLLKIKNYVFSDRMSCPFLKHEVIN